MFTAIGFSSLLTAATTSALIEKFRKESELVRESSKKTIGNLIEKLDRLESQIEDIKSEIKDLKNIIEERKEI